MCRVPRSQPKNVPIAAWHHTLWWEILCCIVRLRLALSIAWLRFRYDATQWWRADSAAGRIRLMASRIKYPTLSSCPSPYSLGSEIHKNCPFRFFGLLDSKRLTWSTAIAGMIFDMCPLGTVAMNVLVVTMPKVISLSTEEAKQCSRVRKR